MTASTLVSARGAVPTTSIGSTLFARRVPVVTTAATGLLVAVGSGVLLATSDHLTDPTAYGIQIAVIIVGTVGAALCWLVRRPGNRLGFALLALAVATAFMSLQGATQPLLHSIGVAADPALFLLGYYVVFAFPNGRLVGRLEKVVLGGIALYFLIGFVPYLFFSPVVSGGAPLAGCNEACPPNGLMIADRPTIAASFGSDLSYMVIALMSATLACLIYRLATASRPRMRALLPVYLPALVLTVPILVFHGVITQLLDASPRTISNAGWFVTVGRSALPYGFVLAIVLSTFFAAAALTTIVGRLVERPNASQLRAVLAEALDDPALELAFPVEGGSGFVDSHGGPVDPTPATGRSATRVERNGETLAVIGHDEALQTDPELVATAGQALLLAIENGRLLTELESTAAELRASRARAVAAGDAERRRIERDLHDGAQQHLVALRIRVGLASELAADDPQVGLRLADLGVELEEILQELRELAQGLDPPVLRQFGLREALASVARRTAPPVTLEAHVGRYPRELESAVYFCCLEALQNIAKHAGAEARAVIRLQERDDRLEFEIRDDGVGYDPGRAAQGSGQGLANMYDRIAALGGTLDLESKPGHGASIRGSLPTPRVTTREPVTSQTTTIVPIG